MSSAWRRRWLRRTNRQLPALPALLVVPGETARIIAHYALVQLENPAADLIEERAVVGDGEDRPLSLVEKGQQRLFQPLDARDIQIVRRFVQEQEVRPAQDQRGDLQARSLPTAELPDATEHVIPSEQVAVEKANRGLLRHRLQ